MTSVPAAVLHRLRFLQSVQNGLGRQSIVTFCLILGISHLCHAQQMKFLVAHVDEIHQFRTDKPAVNQQIIKRNMDSYGILHHAFQTFKLGDKILFLAFFGLAVAVTLAAVAPLALSSRKPLFLAVGLPFFAVKRKVHDKLRTAVAPAHGQQLVAENTPLKHMGEYLADTFHFQSGLRQVGIVRNQHCRKMALLIVFPYGTDVTR